MAIVLTRLDNRLIHGQVIEAWLPYVKADCIVVANDDAASKPLRRKIMRAAVPSSIDVEIGSVEEISRRFICGEFDNRRVLLLFDRVSDVIAAEDFGLHTETLNLGNLSSSDCTVHLTCTISLNEHDISDLEQLEMRGINITSRCIPADGERNWRALIR